MSRHLYGVVSPTYPYTEIVCEFGGPTYDVSAYVEVEADSAREAKVLALRTKEFDEFVTMQRGDGINPFKGVKATRLPECMREPGHDICPQCCPEAFEVAS